MNRLVPLLLLPVLAMAGCAAPPPAPADAIPTPEITETAPETGPTPGGTPGPLPTIPPKLPNEIIRSTFSPDGVENETATHSFSGQPMSVHVLCASYDGAVEVALMVDGEQEITSTTDCLTPHHTVEGDSFDGGTHEVVFRVEATDGAAGVVYLVEGDI